MNITFGFDLHGTIVNSDSAWRKSIRENVSDKEVDIIIDKYNAGISKKKFAVCII